MSFSGQQKIHSSWSEFTLAVIPTLVPKCMHGLLTCFQFVVVSQGTEYARLCSISRSWFRI